MDYVVFAFNISRISQRGIRLKNEVHMFLVLVYVSYIKNVFLEYRKLLFLA